MAAALPAVQPIVFRWRKKSHSQEPCSLRKVLHRRLPGIARPADESIKQGAADANPRCDQVRLAGEHVTRMPPRLLEISQALINVMDPRDTNSEYSNSIGNFSRVLSIDTEKAFRNFIHGYVGASSKKKTFEPETCASNPACITSSALEQNAHHDCPRKRTLQKRVSLQSQDLFHRRSSSDSHRIGSNLAPVTASSPHGKKIQTSDSTNTDAATLRKHARAKLRAKEASESLRILVFGEVSLNEQGKSQIEQCGNKKQVFQLQRVWKELDEDGSGDVDMNEFLNYFDRSGADKLLGMRCVHYLVGKTHGEALLGTRCVHYLECVTCTIVDLMKLIWLEATDEDIKTMLRWFQEAESLGERVSTPPLLSKKKQQQILSAFPRVDWRTHRYTSWENLMAGSPIEESMMKDLWDLHGKNTTDPITKEELLEILCPRGYRAHSDATRAVENKGDRIVWTESEYFTGWVKADVDQIRCGLTH